MTVMYVWPVLSARYGSTGYFLKKNLNKISVQLTTSRTGNLTRLIYYTLTYVMTVTTCILPRVR